MRKLIQGIVDFRSTLTKERRELFSKLALGQKPDALFIACSDSRVVPNLFASSDPGDLFVLRNIGNLIPPVTAAEKDNSASASLEFSLFSLGVSDIVVCGHSDCGAMHAIVSGVEGVASPHLEAWLQYGKEALHKVKKGLVLDPSLSLENQVSQANVIQQMLHILSYPFVLERVEQGLLRLHGWWFDIGRADVYCYEHEINRFVLIDEVEAKILLKKLGLGSAHPPQQE